MAPFRAPFDRWRERDVLLRDGALALALALAAFVPTLSGIGAQIGDLPARPADPLGTGLVLAHALPLTVRRRWPAACLAAVAAAFAVHQALGYGTTFASVGLYLALYSAGAHQVRRRPALAVATGAGGAALAVVLHRLGSPQSVPDYLAFFLILAGFWLVGSTVRARRAAEARRRRADAEAATVTERARIARELHDVVTHHVTAMVVQADAAQFLIASAPERAAEGLAAVSDTGRRALTELRYLLGVLEATGDSASVGSASVGSATGGSATGGAAADGAAADGFAADDRAPAPGRVGDLVERARRAGQPVEFSRQGERRPHAVDVELAAYRVVQEALTNALKHAPGEPTRVLLRYGDGQVRIEVVTDGPATVPAARGASRPGPGAVAGGGAVGPGVVAGGGRGLTGLRARVRMLDGELEAGPLPEGGFEVRAVIPSDPLQE
ncbi:sensor histidine kinase [Kitasatospora sp. NA04385]|uniref:sensor histidine kinase n=1 Tax=Kitasatospora sp. NA04385 TaxID=2742135 RepID=UPI0034CDAC41